MCGKNREFAICESLHGLLSFSTIDWKGVQAERVPHSIFYSFLKCIIQYVLWGLLRSFFHMHGFFFVNHFAVKFMLKHVLIFQLFCMLRIIFLPSSCLPPLKPLSLMSASISVGDLQLSLGTTCQNSVPLTSFYFLLCSCLQLQSLFNHNTQPKEWLTMNE